MIFHACKSSCTPAWTTFKLQSLNTKMVYLVCHANHFMLNCYIQVYFNWVINTAVYFNLMQFCHVVLKKKKTEIECLKIPTVGVYLYIPRVGHSLVSPN